MNKGITSCLNGELENGLLDKSKFFVQKHRVRWSESEGPCGDLAVVMQRCVCVISLLHPPFASQAVAGYWPRAFWSGLCKSFPSCSEVGPELLGTCPRLALSVGSVAGVWANKVTPMVPEWAMSSEAHSGHLHWIPFYCYEVKCREGCKPQGCFYFFGLSDLELLLSKNSAHPIEGRTIYPCDPAPDQHLWIHGD